MAQVMEPKYLRVPARDSIIAKIRMQSRCYIDHSDRIKRSAQYWALKRKAQQDSLAFGGNIIVSPMGYTGYSRLVVLIRDFMNSKNANSSWEDYQRHAAMCMINANIHRILGDDFDTCWEFVMREYGWETIPTHKFVLAYRGSGKSTVAAALMASIFVNLRCVTATIYCGTKPKVQEFLRAVYTRIVAILGQHENNQLKVHFTANEITALGAEDDARWMKALCTRGTVNFFFDSLSHARTHTHAHTHTHNQWYVWEVLMAAHINISHATKKTQ